ncbi:MAG: DNA-directed RNA polymerase subunit A' [DPANN group archaeon]|nr:DNA-directed RNA polymerase subunit A' [DPANN group archaeon]
MADPIVTKKISEISFGVIAPSFIKRIAAVNVVSPELYDADGYPVEKGLMDLSMGVIDPGLRCKVCGGRMRTCPGHFGYIQLAKPVVHIHYTPQLYNILRSFCKSCGRVLLPPEKIEVWKERIQEAKKQNNIDMLHSVIKNAFNQIRRTKKCPYCKEKSPEIKIEKPSSFYEDGKRLWPTEVRERVEKIPDEDLEVVGVNSLEARPEWMVMTTLLVPPITVRPSITLITGERSEDDLTHKLSDIVRVNQRLIENINAGAPEIIIEDLWDLLQYHITTYFDNSVAQVPVARHKSGRPLKTIAHRLKGKEGRFRHNLAGKRVNFCARSVITPDPYISINEIGVPAHIAHELTVPEFVTEWNIDWLKEAIKRTPEYPGAIYVISDEGKRKKITEDTKEQILTELQPGWIVERHLLNGDIVLFNRQPSLHRLSMMGHYVKVVPSKTFRIHPGVTLPYNADFDGDEMNVHVPQTEEARAEAKHLLSLEKNIVTPRYGSSIIGLVEDSLVGLYLLTKENTQFTKEQAADLLYAAGVETMPESAKKDTWTGREIFSAILPGNFNYNNAGMVIEKGKLKEGIASEKHLGPEEGQLLHDVYIEYGPQKAKEIIDSFNKLGLEVVRLMPYTLSFSDLDLSAKAVKRIKEYIIEGEKEVRQVLRDKKAKKIIPVPGKSVKETVEAKILYALNKLRSPVGEIVEKEAVEGNMLVLMAKAGKASLLNLAQMSGFVGQQALRGKRIHIGYNQRALPHFRKGDLSSKARGFIRHSYSDGLDPVEAWFNAVVGRDSYIDTAVRTPKSGYMQRRLINALQDLKTNYDGTVRDSGEKIIQFTYGEDNIDVSKSKQGDIV